MLNLRDPLVQIKITSVVCSTVAIASTINRLVVRYGRMWADDAWALFSMLALLVQVAAVFMHVPNPAQLSRTNRVAAYYLMATTFYAVIWSARLSILFSIIRLDPSETRRKRLRYISVLYFVVCLILMAQLFWVCELEPGWKDMRSPQCTLNKQVAICQLVSDIIADIILIVAPLKLLLGLEDKGLRRRLIVIFSTCIVTTIVSLVHAAYILNRGGPKVVVAALVEDSISLIVCNIPVVVTAAIRLHERQQDQSRPLTFIKFASRLRAPRKSSGATSETAVTLTAFSSNVSDSRGKPTTGTSGGSVFELNKGEESQPSRTFDEVYNSA